MDKHALYLRTSTETQERQCTIELQRDALDTYVKEHRLTVYSNYEDDGVTSGIALSDRPQGSRLIADAKQGCFTHVLVYKLDRLGREALDLILSQAILAKLGIKIESTTENLDTSTASGIFQYNIQAAVNQLEKATIIDRLARGRARAARTGKHVYGVLPFGFDVDTTRSLVHSQRIYGGMTEADIAGQIFTNLANGSTLRQEATRLTLLGIPAIKRYCNGKESKPVKTWQQTRLSYMVKNTAYVGKHVSHTMTGTIERDVPPLITKEVFAAANAQIAKNHSLPKGNEKRMYLLRGLISCHCGAKYVGASSRAGGGIYYRCGMQTRKEQPCNAKRLHAEKLEEFVWLCCVEWIRNPGPYLERARAQLDQRQAQTTTHDTERQQWQQALHEKSLQKDRLTTAYERGILELEDFEARLERVNQDAATIRSTLARLESQRDVLTALEARFTDQAELLASLQAHLETITTPEEQRAVIERMVLGIEVFTTGTGHHKTAELTIRFFFGERYAAFTSRHRPAVRH